MKIQFTEQYKPKASLSDKQAVSEEIPTSENVSD